MSKAQTDIRSTSYDARYARPNGYQGDIDDVTRQMHHEHDFIVIGPTARSELLHYLGVDKTPSAGPSVEMDENPRYGEDPILAVGFFSLANAERRGWLDGPAKAALDFDPSN